MITPAPTDAELRLKRALRRNRALATGLLGAAALVFAATAAVQGAGFWIGLVRAGAEAALWALAAERVQAQREIEELIRRQRAERDAEARRALQQAHAQAQRELDRQVQAQREGREDELRRHGFRGVEVAGLRARQALEDAGARVHATRQLESGLLEVTYSFLGERFISVVQAATLQVVDSGICLGHPPADELVTLDSLPSVIKEAIDTGRLVKLRHA